MLTQRSTIATTSITAEAPPAIIARDLSIESRNNVPAPHNTARINRARENPKQLFFFARAVLAIATSILSLSFSSSLMGGGRVLSRVLILTLTLLSFISASRRFAAMPRISSASRSISSTVRYPSSIAFSLFCSLSSFSSSVRASSFLSLS